MTLANYITGLLYQYDCVIIPNFGGFITTNKHVRVDDEHYALYPPKKQLTFNSHLQHNDGLLANAIVAFEKVTFEEATQKIANEVNQWKATLLLKTVDLKSIGILSLNDDQQVVFEPSKEFNFLTSSFGLSKVKTSLISRYKEEAKIVIKEEPIVLDRKEKREIPSFIKYAATAAILLTLGSIGWKTYENTRQEKLLIEQQESLEKKIQTATFIIDTPLPMVNLNIEKEEESKNYHIVVGAFQLEKNAQKRVRQLKRKGIDARILGKNRWGLTQVIYNSYPSEAEARKELYTIKKTISRGAWLLLEKTN